MRNAGLEETQAGIKIAGRNINNLRYADDTTLMAESEEELKSLLMKVKVESEKVGLRLNIQKTKIMASGPTTSWKIDGETVETVSDFIFGLQMKVVKDWKQGLACALAVGLHFPVQGVQVWSQVQELYPTCLVAKNQNTNNRNNIVKSLINVFKTKQTNKQNFKQSQIITTIESGSR